MPLYVPPSAFDERDRRRADIARSVELVKGQLDYWNRELKKIDPNLQLVKARLDAELSGLRPNFFHVIRDNPGAPPSIFVVEGPNGEYREPDSGMLEALARGDLWSDRSRRAAEKRAAQFKAAAQRQREREREERHAELLERARVANASPSILIKKAV